ncbi:MAG: PEP/pyruvate-binding domain-containing protein [Bacillota bacterium]|nr:PEP/pyruvate-binding domain-containing protein [Bacillota bacterium]
MDLKKLNYYYTKFKFGEDNFHDLMQFRVREILLISTLYDAYTFEQESRLSQQLVGEYHELKLTTIPRITNVPTTEDALSKLEEQHFDLIITTMRISGLSAFELGKQIKEKHPDIPILLLLTNKADLSIVSGKRDEMDCFDNVFLWNGDSKLILAMIKYIEDRKNVEYDTRNGLVRVILLVEDSVSFYSIYLPTLYTEIMIQTQRLISEELNDAQKYYRMRARPKVLCARNYEEAMDICSQYKEFMLCIISDVRYEKDGDINCEAGIELTRTLKDEKWDIPILLQSSEIVDKEIAESMQVHFIHKYSPNLLYELKSFILNNLGFGDFIFRNEKGEEIGRATSLADLENKITQIPKESLLYHSKRNHFSAWLIAHGEIQVARKIKPVKGTDFPDTDAHRQFLVDVFNKTRNDRRKGKVIEFEKNSLSMENQIVKLTEGSLGGKGRGIAFFNSLFTIIELDRHDENVEIKIPKTVIIGTDEYDLFIERNGLRSLMSSDDDQLIQRQFLKGELTETLKGKLSDLLDVIEKPLAVRSSGLLEDSQSQPFAGIYDTFMLPNNHMSKTVRLEQLMMAIKLVYASVYHQNAKSYIESLRYRLEEEKMAVVIQEIVGRENDGFYYPHISGVAQSYNFYPTSHLKHHDGVSMLAVGLGHSIVEGGRNYRFCPRYPDMNFFPIEDQVRYSQTEIYALDMHRNEQVFSNGDLLTLAMLPIKTVEEHKNLTHLASVWDAENNRIDDGLSLPGPRVVNFSNILKYEAFPLAKILVDILDVSEVAFGVPVEIEFAVDLTKNRKSGEKPSFYFLQVRPLTVNTEDMNLNLEAARKEDLILFTNEGMGHGIVDNLYDLVVVDPERFDKTRTADIEKEIEYFNQKMKDENRRYILIGPGRWGSRDRSLGIPVNWGQISQAQVIVEAGIKDFNIEPSQGTHFFHNLIAMNVGYFNISYDSKTDFIDWQWIKSQEPQEMRAYTAHFSCSEPLVVKMDGKKGISMILKSRN